MSIIDEKPSSNKVKKQESGSRGKKFYPKSLSLVALILKHLSNGEREAHVARELGISKQLVSYFVQRAQEQGLVRVFAKDAITIYELTQAGQRFLVSYETKTTLPPLRAEKLSFRADVLEMPKEELNWKRIQVRNWAQHCTTVGDIRVTINKGKNPSIQFLPAPLDGKNPFHMLETLYFDCFSVKRRLELDLKMKIGPIERIGRGEWLVYDPVAKMYSKYYGQITLDGIGKVNASKPRSIGEFEFDDPRALFDYMQMPKRVAKLEDTTERIEKKLEELLLRTEAVTPVPKGSEMIN